MAEIKGLVLSETSRGLVRIQIRPEAGGCGSAASRAGQCHCSDCGTRAIVVEAKNPLGASPGDLVAIGHRPGAVLKSAGALLGIPGAGLILGLAAVAALSGLTAGGLPLGYVVGGAVFLAGVLVGLTAYRRGREAALPIVTRVLAGQMPWGERDPVCGRAVEPASAPARLIYAGRDYYFCRADCMQVFLKDPSRYAGAPAGPETGGVGRLH